MKMEVNIHNVNRVSKCFILRKWIFLSIFILLFQGCEPLEAITDTYSDIIDEVSSDGNDDNLAVGQVIVEPSFTSGTAVTMTVTVLNKEGNFIRDDTEVKCIFTNSEVPEFFFDFIERTISGTVVCNTNNTAGTSPFPISFVATSEGVSSDPIAITLPPGATTG